MKIIFMGTPEFAVPSLKRVIADGYEVSAVYTNPDKPKNRGMKLTPSPVKVVALENDIRVIQPTSLKNDDVIAELKDLEPDLIIVAAYGKILPKAILDIPKLGCINVHSSLLPKYRGAAPINWAIINGEKQTGVTIMYMAQALDAGDIIAQTITDIGENENAEELYSRLADLGAELLSDTITRLADGRATRTPQTEEFMTYAPMLSRDLSPIDWSKSAEAIHNQIRGLVSWPASTFELENKTFKAYASEIGAKTDKSTGTLIGSDKKGILFACGDGNVLRITELQAPGKKRMKASDFLRGHKI